MKLRTVLLFVLQLGLLSSLVTAQGPKVTPVPPTPQAPTAGEASVTEPPHELTAADVHAFLDGFVPMQLEREDIAGAVVLVADKGKPVYHKAFGYLNFETKVPMDTASLFELASVSKQFR